MVLNNEILCCPSPYSGMLDVDFYHSIHPYLLSIYSVILIATNQVASSFPLFFSQTGKSFINSINKYITAHLINQDIQTPLFQFTPWTFSTL